MLKRSSLVLALVLLMTSLCVASSPHTRPPERPVNPFDDPDPMVRLMTANQVFTTLVGESHDMAHLVLSDDPRLSLRMRVRTSATGYEVIFDPHLGYRYDLPGGELYEQQANGTFRLMDTMQERIMLQFLLDHVLIGCNEGCGPTNTVGGEPAPTPTPVQTED